MTERLILLVAVLALVAAACGESGDGDESGVASLSPIHSEADTSATGVNSEAEVDAEEALLDLTQCIRDQGIDIADPTVDSDGNPQLARPGSGENGPPEGFREAIQICAQYLEGVTLGRQGQDLDALQDTLVEYAACMRSNGYEMDDPDFSNLGQPGEGGGPGQGGGVLGDIDREDPEFVDANEQCEDILAGFGPRGGGGLAGGRPPSGDGA